MRRSWLLNCGNPPDTSAIHRLEYAPIGYGHVTFQGLLTGVKPWLQ